METPVVYWAYIGIMENKMETTVVYCNLELSLLNFHLVLEFGVHFVWGREWSAQNIALSTMKKQHPLWLELILQRPTRSQEGQVKCLGLQDKRCVVGHYLTKGIFESGVTSNGAYVRLLWVN